MNRPCESCGKPLINGTKNYYRLKMDLIQKLDRKTKTKRMANLELCFPCGLRIRKAIMEIKGH